MKCRLCGKELNQSGGYCPQCGFNVDANDFESILREIVRLNGEEMLYDGKGLLSLLADIAPELRKERNLLFYLINVNGNKTILDAGKRGENDLQEAIQRTSMQISDEYSVDPSKAEEICVTFASAAFPDSKPEKPGCPRDLKEKEKVCPHCGHVNKFDSVTCSNCGGKMNGEEPNWIPIAVVLLLVAIIFMSFHKPISPVIANGKCGDQCSWNLSQDGVLTISGKGAMYDYGFNNNAPWHDYDGTIRTIVVKNGITRIGEDAFWGSYRLTRVVLPESLEEIAGTAFSSCRVLPEFEINPNNPNFSVEAGVLFSKDMTKLICYPGGKSATKYDVPDSVTEIGEYAFHGSRIIELVLPEHLQIIGSNAFSHTEITGIRIPSGVKTIPGMAFYECRPLKTIYIPQSVAKIEWLAFDHTGLTDIFYEGSQLQWDAIKIDSLAEDNILSSTKIHYNSW